MRVLALVSFVARVNGDTLSVQAGALVELPAGADWLAAGLATPAPETELATAEPDAERAVAVRPRRRKAADA